MGIVKSATGGYVLGFVLVSAVAMACLGVLAALRSRERRRGHRASMTDGAWLAVPSVAKRVLRSRLHLAARG
jgi:hypothetical protein